MKKAQTAKPAKASGSKRTARAAPARPARPPIQIDSEDSSSSDEEEIAITQRQPRNHAQNNFRKGNTETSHRTLRSSNKAPVSAYRKHLHATVTEDLDSEDDGEGEQIAEYNVNNGDGGEEEGREKDDNDEEEEND